MGERGWDCVICTMISNWHWQVRAHLIRNTPDSRCLFKVVWFWAEAITIETIFMVAQRRIVDVRLRPSGRGMCFGD